MLRLQKCGRGFLYPCLKFKRLRFLLTDRGIICVSCAGAAVYRLSENGKYEETITYIDGLEDEEIPQISINEKEEYFIVMPNARKIFKCFKGEN